MLSIFAEVSGAERGVVASSVGGRVALDGNEEPHRQGYGLQVMTAERVDWTLSLSASTLESQGKEVSLTHLETLILDELVQGQEAVVSKERIIVRLGRDADHYSGLEMCMSRLQRKFKKHSGQQRLFVAVRNRGYRLTQRIWLSG